MRSARKRTDALALHLKKAYSSSWFTYNQLAEVTPMPLAWDVTSTGAKKGSGGCATSPVPDSLPARAGHLRRDRAAAASL